MAKKKNVAVDEGMNTDGNRAINKFRISDAVMMLILVIYVQLVYCRLFICWQNLYQVMHMSLQNRWHFGQKGLTLMLIRPFLKMVAWYTV